jgi:DNA-binding IclR family transcriptional regulator
MRSVKTALQVLEAVARLQPVGLSELARSLGLPKTTVQRGLATLGEAGWLESDPLDPTRWVVGVRVFQVGSTVGERGGLRERALPHINHLAADVQETVHLMVPDGDGVVLIERIDSIHPVRAMAPLGSRVPLHASSNGKAILAYLPGDEIDRYLAGKLNTMTPRTITDATALRRELSSIRERGYAINDEELQDGVVSVAASIRPGGGRPIASVSISGPKSRMPDSVYDDYGRKVTEAVSRIAVGLPTRVLP